MARGESRNELVPVGRLAGWMIDQLLPTRPRTSKHMTSKLGDLPVEVLQRIVSYVAAESIGRAAAAQLSLVSRRFADAAHLRIVQLRSAKSAEIFAEILSASRIAADRVRRLTFKVDEGSSTQESKTRRRKRGSTISPDQVARICDGLRYLEVLALRSVDLSALRRRQMAFTASLAQMHTLLVASPQPDEGASKAPHLNLHTLGMLVTALPSLRHLCVRGIRGSSASLRGVPPPSCCLVSLALYDLVDVTSAHLAWLLASTTREDSLRQLAFELFETARPAQWSAIKWALLPVREVYVTSPSANAIEKLPQHFPSLEAYHFCTTAPVNLDGLAASLPAKRRTRLYDHSSARGGTLDLKAKLQDSPNQMRFREREQIANISAAPISRTEPLIALSPYPSEKGCPTCWSERGRPTRRMSRSAVLSWEQPARQGEPIMPDRYAAPSAALSLS